MDYPRVVIDNFECQGRLNRVHVIHWKLEQEGLKCNTLEPVLEGVRGQPKGF